MGPCNKGVNSISAGFGFPIEGDLPLKMPTFSRNVRERKYRPSKTGQ